MQRIRCHPSNFSRLHWHLGPILALLGLSFSSWKGANTEDSRPKFCIESKISGRKKEEGIKAACHANFWGFSCHLHKLSFQLQPPPLASWPNFWPFLGPFFASVAVKAGASRPEFCRESDIKGRKQRKDGICRESGARRPEDQKSRGHQLQKKCGIPPEATRHLRKISSIPEEQKPLGTSPTHPLENFYTMF